MSEYVKYEIKVEGTSPMIQNKLDRELNREFSKVEKDKKEAWEESNWHRKLYTKEIDGKQQVIWPEENVHGMLVAACKKFKVSPPKSVGKTWTGYFKSSVLVEAPAVISGSKPEAFGKMVNGNPSASKGSSKVYRVRPMIKTWTTIFHIVDLEGYLDNDTLMGIVETAGKFVGLSDWRPQHGRFAVLKIKKM